MLEKKASANFYSIAAIEGIVLVALTIYVILLSSKHVVVIDQYNAATSTCFSTDSDEYMWRIVATSIAVPLVIEYLLDFFINVLYPSNSHTNKHALEDRLGHAIIVSSLLPVSYLPFWLFGPSICTYRDTLVSLGHALLVCGVLGKLETFSSDIWHQSDAIMVLSIFFCAQISLLSGLSEVNGNLTYNATLLQVACAFKLLSTLIFLTSSRNIKIIFHEVREGDSNFFATRKYLCSTLFSGLVMFMFASSYFCYQAYVRLPATLEIIAVRIMVTIAGVVATAIVPGRIMRRGLQAMQQTVVMEREMNYKKTFVRYISHEIRSPLSNASMGLDCMLDALKSERRINRAELLDLARDCKVSCTSAVQTLSDLLLFDKIENQMLALERSTVNCDMFFKQCVCIFNRQLKMSGIAYNIDIDVHLSMMTMYIDTSKMEQVIRNYITNAIKFTPPGGSITVRAKLLSYEESTLYQQSLRSDEFELQGIKTNRSEIPAHFPVVHFEVIDTGFGIAQENQHRLFQQYVQFDANRLQGGKGSGLGLWICKTIVDMHGGCVGAMSVGPGCGSTFYFELPITEVLSNSSSSSSAPVTSSNISGTAKSTTGDDSEELRNNKKLRSRQKVSTNAFINSLSTKSDKTGRNNFDRCGFGSESSLSSHPLSHFSTKGSTVTSNSTLKHEFDMKTNSFSASDKIVPIDNNHNINLESMPVSHDSDISGCFLPTLSPNRKKRRSPSSGEEDISLKNKRMNRSQSFIRNSLWPVQRSYRDEDSDEFVSEASSSDSHPDNLPVSVISLSVIAPSFPAKKQSFKSRYLELPNNKWNVLLIDDSNISRKLMSRFLLPYSSHIYTAVDGHDALEKFPSLPSLDIIFIDYYMPRLTGPETIQLMREKYQFSGVIVSVTGALSREEQDTLVSAGVDVAMSKPFDLSEFLKIMFTDE